MLAIPLIVFFTKNSTEISNNVKNHSVILTQQMVPGDAWDECGNQDAQWGCKDSCSCIQEPGNPYYWQCIPERDWKYLPMTENDKKEFIVTKFIINIFLFILPSWPLL